MQKPIALGQLSPRLFDLCRQAVAAVRLFGSLVILTLLCVEPSIAMAAPLTLDILGVAPGAHKNEADTTWKRDYPHFDVRQDPFVLNSDNDVHWQFVWERIYTLEPISPKNDLQDMIQVHFEPRTDTILSLYRYKEFAHSTQLTSVLVDGLIKKYGLPSYYFDSGFNNIKLLWADGFPTVNQPDRVIYSDHPVIQCGTRAELYASKFFNPRTIINELANPQRANSNRFDGVCGKTVEVVIQRDVASVGHENGYALRMEVFSADLGVANTKMTQAAAEFFSQADAKHTKDTAHTTRF